MKKKLLIMATLLSINLLNSEEYVMTLDSKHYKGYIVEKSNVVQEVDYVSHFTSLTPAINFQKIEDVILVNHVTSPVSTWSLNLPSQYDNGVSIDGVNNGDFTFNLTEESTAFLLRSDNWWSVNLTGWNYVGTENFSINETPYTGSLYTRTLPAGQYTFNNASAIYMFMFN